jgi:lipopolysaccharide transport system permease protein
MGIVKSVWSYRGFIAGSVQREFQSKYRNSLFGAAWSVINPLAMIVVYTIIFSQIMRARLPGVDSTFAYSIYLCAGVLTWGLFAEITSRSLTMFIENANLIKKINFPRLCLPVTVVATACMNFAIIFGLFTLFLIVTGSFPGWTYLALVPVLLIHIALAVGIGMTLGVLNVFFRDVGQFFGIVLQFWFWMTPVVYPLNILPERLIPLANLNPLLHLTTAYQTILVNGALPGWRALTIVALMAVGLCLLSLRVYRKRAGEMVDEL